MTADPTTGGAAAPDDLPAPIPTTSDPQASADGEDFHHLVPADPAPGTWWPADIGEEDLKRYGFYGGLMDTVDQHVAATGSPPDEDQLLAYGHAVAKEHGVDLEQVLGVKTAANTLSGTPQDEEQQVAASPLTEQQRRFFDQTYPSIQKLAGRLGVNEDWLLGLSAYESGYLDDHNLALKNPFGITQAGGKNIKFNTLDNASDFFAHNFGDAIQGSKTAEEFVDRLFNTRYNSKNPNWKKGVAATIHSITARKQLWQSEQQE